MDAFDQFRSIKKNFLEYINNIDTLEKLEELRIEFLGRKGKLTGLLTEIPKLPPDVRPKAGKLANEIKDACLKLYKDKYEQLKTLKEAESQTNFDSTIPGRDFWNGSLHPDTIISEEICKVFTRLGYDIVSGPEVEIDWYNFEALNLPPDHPARDMQDTLYITDNILLRTHTSPVQIRSMLNRKPPLAVIAPGKVYRRDSDITHTPMFHQIEGLMVDRNISLANLKGTLLAFIQAIFGRNTKLRFRPSFFPFTEPSAEVDITCALCHGEKIVDNKPCRVCKGTGWVEILGCGMVDPAVFKSVNYPDDISGFAFGMGIERIAMLKYGINDLRLFFQNDLRFLEQFGRLS